MLVTNWSYSENEYYMEIEKVAVSPKFATIWSYYLIKYGIHIQKIVYLEFEYIEKKKRDEI